MSPLCLRAETHTGRGPPPCDLKKTRIRGFLQLNYVICNFAEFVLKLFVMWEDRERLQHGKELIKVGFFFRTLPATMYENICSPPPPLRKSCVRHYLHGSVARRQRVCLGVGNMPWSVCAADPLGQRV